jgi:hypothetical protein
VLQLRPVIRRLGRTHAKVDAGGCPCDESVIELSSCSVAQDAERHGRATPANVSTRFIGADPEVEGVARISYNVE